ncbi:MAG: hypothetical protein M1834_005377 [Cirrosporium novae-zelandiae]|nr:MAG: hypothetical protein M1834_005377 [Cirrosporium novae-zelandiae]
MPPTTSSSSSSYTVTSSSSQLNPGFIYESKAQLITILRQHKANTLGELCRIERTLAAFDTPDITEPMTSAWRYYVDSNSMLSELRSLSRTYPFSSECLDEAKLRVMEDPASTRSWNYAWLILKKIEELNLIPTHAGIQAAKQTMWGGHTPTPNQISQLTATFVSQWTEAVRRMLRAWNKPPTVTGQ